MELKPNKGKSLLIEIDGKKYARYPIKTKLITPEDEDIIAIVQEFAKLHIKSDDILFISEKAVAITQGRSYHINSIKPSWLAKELSKYVMRTSAGIGLGSPQTMQLAIEEVGILRILVAAFVGAFGKVIGIKGLFYIIAGSKARSIDGAVPYAIPPYNNYVSKGPFDPGNVARDISKKLGVQTVIVDANDLGVNVLGASYGVNKKLVAQIIKDNPLGQTNEQTPLGIIRKI
jgi:F420-0:gamma-glutamyl ligase-like protein